MPEIPRVGMTDARKKIRRRPLGKTGLTISQLGFGAAPLGNLFSVVEDAVAGRTLRAALSAGMSYVDTAPYYGAGLSERRVGDAIRGQDVVLSTKVGRLLRPVPHQAREVERDGFVAPLPFEPVYDYSYEGIMRSWEASLQRLGVAKVDVLFVHDIGTANHGDKNPEMLSQLINGGFRALRELRDSGAIKAFGLGVNEWEICLEVMQHVELDVVLLAGRYTLLDHAETLSEFMPACIREGVSLVIGGVFNSGILATGTRREVVPYFNYAPARAEIVERVRKIEAVCGTHNVPLRAAAVQFPLGHPAVASVLIGLANERQLQEALQAYSTPIPGAFWEDLRSERLLTSEAPVRGSDHDEE